jgi:hypothetical protein
VRRDLLVCTGGDRGGPVRIYRNRGADGFRDVTDALGVTLDGRDAVLKDLNGDRRRDLAAVDASGLRVQLARAGGGFRDPVRVRRLTAGAGLALRDVDRDGDRDAFVVQGCTKDGDVNEPDRLLLNRGEGTEFKGVKLAQVAGGCGDAVVSLRYAHRPAFLVLNGAGRHAGPVQLLAVR